MARTCEQCLAIRAQFSKPRHLPKPLVVSAAQQLRKLLAAHPLPEPVYARAARRALAEGHEPDIERELRSYQQRLAQHQASRQKLIETHPLLYPAAP